MAHFECKVSKIKVQEHPNADALEIAHVDDYRVIVRKGMYTNGDLVAYIPEGACLPESLIKEMGLEGRLHGSEKNRVKAIKMRGVLSQGLVYPAKKEWRYGSDVAPELGIWKYEPVVPAGFQGELQSVGGSRTISYDIENIKKYAKFLTDGEQVVFTEKLHGTFAIFGVMGRGNLLSGPFSRQADYQPDEDNSYEESRLVVASKGVASKGLAFKVNAEANKNNIYVKTAKHLDIVASVEEVFGLEKNVFILGEIFGPGVQDLHYGLDKPEFRIFDIYVGDPGIGRFLNHAELTQKCQELGIPRVPVLYEGPFSREVLDLYTNGKETIGGRHVREGLVVRPVIERISGSGDLPCWDRLQLKSVSEDYLLRKGNVTEFA